MTIILTPETETRLRERAARDGQDVSALVEALLVDALTPDSDVLTEGQAAEVRAGLRRSLEAAEAGRVTPLAQAVAEARQRHGFSPAWASGAGGTA